MSIITCRIIVIVSVIVVMMRSSSESWQTFSELQVTLVTSSLYVGLWRVLTDIQLHWDLLILAHDRPIFHFQRFLTSWLFAHTELTKATQSGLYVKQWWSAQQDDLDCTSLIIWACLKIHSIFEDFVSIYFSLHFAILPYHSIWWWFY